MSEWSMFFEFVVEVSVVFVLVVLAMCIAMVVSLWKDRNRSEIDSLRDAEWFIKDYCNSQKYCCECHKYDELHACCGYCTDAPYNWRGLHENK